MKQLPSQEYLKSILFYDPKSGRLFWKARPIVSFQSVRIGRSWNRRYCDKEAFTASDKKGYKVGAINNVYYRASRVIFKLIHNIDAFQVDHIDGNNKNNLIENLRNVSSRDNQMNMKKPKTNTSGVMGVSWNTEKSAWDAVITVKQKRISLGRFKVFEDAVSARKNAEKLYGFHPNHGRD